MTRVARALLGVVALAGCGLGAHPDASKLFALTALAQDGATPTHVVLGLGPIELPAYLARTQIVRRVGDNELRLAGFDRWAEPLPEGVARTLQRNLTVLLGAERVLLYPCPPGTRADAWVGVEIVAFEPRRDGEATLTARWNVRDATGAQVVARGDTHLVEPAAGTDTGAAVAAMSRALVGLSEDIARAVRDRPRSAPRR
ncbi:MAG TPA: PqiC family protein [Candidatus Binatia bacterium]|nr:PqiC family protein [Candidatus Binatia bacterium]